MNENVKHSSAELQHRRKSMFQISYAKFSVQAQVSNNIYVQNNSSASFTIAYTSVTGRVTD